MRKLETGVTFFGMMNSGKTTIAQLIAQEQGLPIVDTDALVADEAGATPGEIIAIHGPEEFMVVQRKIILARHAFRGSREIWATGGAVARDTELVQAFGEKGVNVFLRVDPDLLEARTPPERIANLANPNNLSFKNLYRERMPFYKAAANVTVEIDDPNETPDVTAHRVVDLVLARS